MRDKPRHISSQHRDSSWLTRGSHIAFWAGLLALVMVCNTPVTLGQVITGTISGTVTDPSKGVVPDATVTITNVATNAQHTYMTGRDGEYSISLLPIATYSISVSSKGFKTSTTTGIRVTSGSSIRVDFQLEVGATTETVEVRATAPLLHTASAQVGTAVDGRSARDLPLAGRDILRLATLGPGVVQRQTSSIQLLTDTYLGSNIPTIAGGRGESTSFTLGGINVNNRRLNLPMEKPSLDAIEEFTVLANNYSAEYGQGDGQILVEFRSGSNKFHGSVYDFLRNDALNARGFFDPDKPPLRYNQFGANAGGPIWTNRTFFFANFEGIRNPSSSTQGGLFPTAAMLGGDFSQFKDIGGNVIPIYDPATTDPVTGVRQQFPGNVIPADRISPIAKSLYGMYGAPTPPSYPAGGGNNVISVVPRNFTVDTLAVKIDHHFGSGDTLSTRYSITDPRTFSGSVLKVASGFGDGRNQIMGQTWTHIFSPGLLNEFRVGYVRQRGVSIPQLDPSIVGKDLQAMAGFPNPLPFNYIPTTFFQGDHVSTPSFNQLNGVAGVTGGSGEVQQTYQFIDNLAWVRGKHAFKFGVDLRRRRWDTVGLLPSGGGSIQPYGEFTSQLEPDPSPTAPAGNVRAVQGTGSPLADFLLGQIGTVAFGLGTNLFSYRDSMYSWFAQDTWRITPRFTVGLGVRWDYSTPIMEKGGRQSWAVWGDMEGGVCPDGCLLNDGKFGGTYDPIINPFPGEEKIRPGGMIPDRNNFAPRISLAYRFGSNTVFRVGSGIFYSIYGQNNFPGATNPPFGSGYMIFTNQNLFPGSNPPSGYVNSIYRLDNLYPPATTPSGQKIPGTVSTDFYYDIRNVTPAIYNASAAIQHAFTPTLSAEIGYLGKFGRHWSGVNSINPCTTSPCGYDPVYNTRIRIVRNFAGMALVQTNNSTSYNAGYIKAERKFAQGASFLASWTWSRSLVTGGDSEANDIFLGAAGGLFSARDRPRHLSSLDATHRLVISGIYELPFGRGKQYASSASGALDQLVGGWQVNWITAFQSGTALDMTGFGSYFKPGQGPNLKRWDYRKTGYFFDPNIFTSDPSGDPIPYTNFRGAGINNWDISFFKMFRITEWHRLQFRAEFFNIWNHGQFETPGHYLWLPGFGQFQARQPAFMEYGVRPARVIELALKYQF